MRKETMKEKKMERKNLYVIFNGQVDEMSMGGGDKIVLNISKRIKNNVHLFYLTCPEGELMVRNFDATISIKSLNSVGVRSKKFLTAYLKRVVLSLKILKIVPENDAIIWSSSDFLPDSLPGLFFKLIHRKSIWFVNMFLRARNPFKGEVENNLSTILYFVSQQMTLILAKYKAKKIFVLSHQDVDYLVKKGFNKNKVIRLQGGIDLEEFNKVPAGNKIYEACFVGRFHYQKGLSDLVEIWANVVKKYKSAKLAVIGWGTGDEQKKLEQKIKANNLENNIILLGFKDGSEKIKIMKESKMLLFTSSFESWGVVVAEGIASNIPVVAYKLPHIYKNFPKGVVMY